MINRVFIKNNLIYPFLFPFLFIIRFYLRTKSHLFQKPINLIEGNELAKLCDYSFGDPSSVLYKIPGSKFKLANQNNVEFRNLVLKMKQKRNYMTLFIDNIRLYNRKISVDQSSAWWLSKMMAENDLLRLCSVYSNMNFIIFTNLDDTPIDSNIEPLLPSNVLQIYATNAVFNSEKVSPFPYGIQRRLWRGDIKMELLLSQIKNSIKPNKLLYINHSVHTNIAVRAGIKEMFLEKTWATVRLNRLRYEQFLREIKAHKFVICPIGNAIDCHRNWEVLYMRRVPVMIKNEYLQKLFSKFPVLFVDSFSDITEELLINNDHLFQEALSFNMKSLDLNYLFTKILSEFKFE